MLSLIGVAGATVFFWRAIPGFALVIGIAYLAVRWLNTQSNPAQRWNWACLALFLMATVFTLGRLQHWDRPVSVLGPTPIVLYILDMWLMLRLVTLFWEVGSGTIEAPPFSRYILWICLPFTLSGPLLRFSEMPAAIQVDRRLWKSVDWWMEGCVALSKLALGIALGIGQLAMSSRWPHARLWNNAIASLITGPIGFYLTTAGYFQFMEVLGRPAGFKLPPSFNYPLGRENISAFWMNWNMTATFVFRDYLFYNRWGQRTYNIYFNTLLLFTLVGLWHAANAYWILWGFLHGVLFCIYLLWRKYNNRLGAIPLRGTAFSRISARVLTYLVVCLCWYLPSKIIQKLSAGLP